MERYKSIIVVVLFILSKLKKQRADSSSEKYILSISEKEPIDELAQLDVVMTTPSSNINKKEFDSILEKESFEDFLKKEEIDISNVKEKGSAFGNFFCSLLTGTVISGGLFVYKMNNLGLLSLENLSSSFSSGNIAATLNGLNNIIPNVPVDGNVLLGTIASIIFIFLFTATEFSRKAKVKLAQKILSKEIDSYHTYAESKLSSFLDISEFLGRVDKEIIAMSILLDEENAKLRRINFMKKDGDKPDLKTVKDITRAIKLIENITDLLTTDMLEDNELSMDVKGALGESEEYIEKHIKKIYRSEEA